MTDTLKPCPFCGGNNLKTGGDDKVVGVWCLTCQSAGPNHYGKHEWNDRAALSRPIDPKAEVEPVAWRYKIKAEYGWSDWVIVKEVAFLEEYKRDRPHNIVIEPLFASPSIVGRTQE